MQKLILSVLGFLLLLPFTYAGEVNINTADAQTLAAELKGIGLSKAKAIVEHRENYGRFASADELAMVKGIGLRTVELNRENIQIEKPRQD